MEIRSLTFNDIPIVQKLARVIWEEHYIQIISQEQIDYMLELFYSKEKIQSEIENGFFWGILYFNKKPMGYLACEIQKEKAFLSKIYLKKECRGKGFGKLLLEKAIEIAQNNHKDKLYLNVNKFNSNSILFYERNGFTKIEEGIFEIGNGYVMDDFIYELKV